MRRAKKELRAQRLSLLSTGLALVIAFVLLVLHQYYVGHRMLVEELRTEAAIIGENSSAALVFGDARAATEIIASIRHTPRIVAAALYRADGTLLARQGGATAAFPALLTEPPAATQLKIPAETRLGLTGGIVREEIRVDGHPAGTLVLVVDFRALYWRLLEYAAGVIGIAAVALGLAYRLTAGLRRRVARTEEQLERYALYDPVTSLPNRRMFEQELRKTVSRVRREGKPAALFFVDVDDFKKVNDSFGHEVGDRVLVMIAERMGEAIRAGDVVARIGGDEFAVILHGVGDGDSAAVVARNLVRAIAEPFPTSPTPTHVGLSIGIAMVPDDGDDAGVLLRNADMAMYVAKAYGKNGYQFYSEAIDGQVRRDLRLETGLRRAIDGTDPGLSVAYQPKFCARTRQVVGVEALTRWVMPDGQVVSPAEFIAVAEHTGLIVGLGNWLLERVCAELAELYALGIDPPVVAVNVSPFQLLRGDELVTMFRDTLARHGESAAHFEIELTESALTESRGASALDALREAGFVLAIDDFGTGYSSLGYLKRFHISTLKVDQSFVRGLPADEGSAAIVHAVVRMAHALGIAVVAEGVETEEQAAFLTSGGCDVLQGFLLGRPMALADLATLLRTRG